MLGRAQSVLRTRRVAGSTQRRLFASAAFNDWSSRISQLKSQYPGLYDSFEADQQSLFNDSLQQRSSLVSEYESARARAESQSGFGLFKSVEELNLADSQPPLVKTVVLSESEAEDKMDYGSQLVSKLLSEQQSPAETLPEKNLRMINVAAVADEIDDWRRNLKVESSDSVSFGLPIEDEELDAFVAFYYTHNCDDSKLDEFLSGLDEVIIRDLLLKRDPSFDVDRWKQFCETTNELFHPTKIEHYNMNNLAKALFRGALWQGGSRTEQVEKSMITLAKLMASEDEDFASVLRNLYEMYPESDYGDVAVLQLQLTDPLFAARLIDEIRVRFENVAFDRAVSDVLLPIEGPDAQERLSEARNEVETCLPIFANNAKRNLASIEAEISEMNRELPSLDEVLNELLPARLWGADTSAVASAIKSYASGSGSLSGVTSAINSTLSSVAKQGGSSLDELGITDFMVRYHNAKFADKQQWSLREYLFDLQLTTPDDRARVSQELKQRLEKYNLDPLVVAMVRQAAVSGHGLVLDNIIDDFKVIMKNYRGEVEGIVTSAEPLDEATYSQIKDALDRCNPGKKITLERRVEPGLGAGFVVKAGVQRFDFSLAAHIDESRRALSL